MAERTLSREADEVPVDEQEVEARGIRDEDRLAFESLDPRDVRAHGGLGFLQILSASGPGFRLRGPPLCRLGMRRRTVESLEIRREGRDEFLVRGVAAEPKLSMEWGPGIGPSVSTSVLM